MAKEKLADKPSETVSSLTFEAAYARLEEILEKMNSSALPLEESIILYEEADSLMKTCQLRLSDAEKRIEVIVKGKSGEISLTSDQKPMLQEFQPPRAPLV